MRTGGVWRSIVLFGVAGLAAIAAISCQPRSDNASHHGDVAMPNSVPTIDHHPPARTPEN